MRASLALVACLALLACGGDDSGGAPDATPMVDADTGPTWTSFASGYFETYCYECHGPGDLLRDYSDLAMVRAEVTTIRTGTASGQFPIGNGPFPSQSERDLLIAWIDADTPE